MGLFDDVFDFLGDVFEFALGWLMPDIDQGKQSIKIERQGADQPIPIVYGTQKVGAIKVHKYVTDTPEEADNDLLHLICVFSEGEVDAIEEIYFNGISENDPKWSGGSLSSGKWFQIYRYNGEEGQPASPEAVSGIPNWTIDHRLDGLCYAYIVCQLPFEESEVRGEVWRGEPQIQARIRGRKILDTRTGVTAYSENPAMCLRDYLTNSVYGRNLPTTRINDASFEAVADFCDTAISNEVTTTAYNVDRSTPGNPIYTPSTSTTTVEKPLFTTNIIIDTEKNSFDNVKELLSTFRGILPPSAGMLKLRSETEGDPEFIFDDDNIDMDEPIDVDSGQINDRANRVEIRFPNKAKEYETDSVFYPEESDPIYQTWLDEDGGKKLDKSLEFSGITSKDEALQMAKVVANKSRFTKSVSFTSEAIGFIVEVGDIVGLNNGTNGWNEKPFRVVEKNLRPDDNVDFKLLEHEDAIYPWSGATYDELEGGTWLGDPNDIAPPTGLSLTQDSTLATTGRLTWTPVNNAFVRNYGVLVEKTAQGDGTPIDPPEKIFATQVSSASYTVPLLDVGEYQLRVRSISTTGYPSGYSALSVTLAAPVPPNSIILTPSDWEIEVRPQLSGVGLGTQFEFDVVAGDGSGYTPESRARASAYTASGLLPDTLYTVFVRTVNAYGVSAWVSESATTTVTGEQVDPYLNTIRDELDNIDLRVDDIEAGPMDINDLLEQVSQDITEVFQRREDVDTEAKKRTQQVQEINAEIENVAAATNLRIDEVFADAEGNATAISGLQLEVSNVETDLSATINRVDQVEVTGDGNASAISVLQGQVNDPVNNTSALYLTAQEAKTTADGSAESVTTILNGVTGETGEAQALNRLEAYFTDGGLGARAFLGTNVNNQITGVVIDDDGVERVIEFVSDSVRFVDGNGTLKIYYNLNNNRYVFDGEIAAVNSTFSGTVSASNVVGSSIEGGNINIGSGNFVVDSNGNITQDGGYYRTSDAASGETRVFIDGRTNPDYLIWIGEGARSDSDGLFWIKPDGTGYISGEFIEGGVVESHLDTASRTTLGASEPSVSHDSAGNDVEVTGTANVYFILDGNFSGFSFLRMELQRNGTAIKNFDRQINGQYVSSIDSTIFSFDGSFSYIDTTTSQAQSYTYSFEVSSSELGVGGTEESGSSQDVSVKTFENRLLN